MSLVMLKVQLDQGINEYFRLTCSFIFLKEVANLVCLSMETVPSGPLVTLDKFNRSFTLATVFSTPLQTISLCFTGVPLVWI